MIEPRKVLRTYLARAGSARAARRAGLHALTGTALAGGLLAASVALLVVAPALRPWLLVALASVGLVTVGLVVGALLRPSRPATLATWVARRDPALGGDVADAFELAERLAGKGRPVPEASAVLAEAHAARVAGRAQADDATRHARAAMPSLPWGPAGGALLAAGLLLVVLPTGRHRLIEGASPSAIPRITYGDVALHLRFPAYLGMPDRLVADSTGDLEAPVGTHVDISVVADRPLRTARLEPEGGGPIEMTTDGETARGTLVVIADSEYRIRLTGTAGEIDPDSPLHAIRAVPDLPPQVRLRSPREDLTLPEGSSFPLAFSVDDDHGVSEVVLVVQPAEEEPAAPGLAPHRIPLLSAQPARLSADGRRDVAVAELGLAAGDEALFWVEAKDTDEVSGPKWAASSRIRLRVPSPDEDVRELDVREEELAEQLLATLGAHLLAGPDRVTTKDGVVAAHQQLGRALAEAQGRLTALIDMAGAQGEDATAVSALEDMRSRLEGLAHARLRRAGALLGDDAKLALESHADLHPREIEELEGDVLFFDMWADRRASLRASDTAEELVAAIARLDALLAQDPAASQEALSQALAEVERLREALAPQVDGLAQSGADPADARAARDAMEQLAARQAAAAEAHARHDRAGLRAQTGRMQRIAANLADLVDSMAQAGALGGDEELAKEIRQAVGDLRRLKRDQVDLRDQTNGLREDARAAMAPEDLRRADEMFEELLRKADEALAAEAEAEKLLSEAPPVRSFFEALEVEERVNARVRDLLSGGVAPGQDDEIQKLHEERARAFAAAGPEADLVDEWMRQAQRARENLGRLRQVLADRDLPSVEAPARWSLGALQRLAEQLEPDGDEAVRASLPPTKTAAARVAEILDRLDDLEQQVERSSQGALTTAQRERLSQMAEQQSGLEVQARQLGGRLRDLGADVPFLGDDVAEAVDQAGGSMDDAADGLHGRKPGAAAEHQGEAVAHLDEALKGLEPGRDRGDGSSGHGKRPGPGGQGQGRRPGQRGGQGAEDRFGDLSRENVEIPDADAYKVPREFREEILEAMRESDAPEGYEEQVREYYRRLVE
jgi:hypothetical protein